MENELRPFWGKHFGFNWKFGLVLLLAICIPRFVLVLHANASGNYGSIGLIMLLSAIAPYIFLSKVGRKKIGIIKPGRFNIILLAFVGGLIASLALYLVGKGLYGHSFENWYQYIGKSYKIPQGINAGDKAILFTIMAVTGMTFSPIGEEFFFRGIVHTGFANSIGEKGAAVVDSAAFALVHISHFGLVFINNQWKLLLCPTILWVAGMFLLSMLFFICKKHAGSLWGAIICHAAFNFGMIYCIFYML